MKSESLNEKLLKIECSICLQEIQKGENICIPACDCKELLYHTTCYYKWIDTNPTCPQCRTKIQIIVEGEEEEEEEGEYEKEEEEEEEEELESFDNQAGYNIDITSITENNYHPRRARVLGRDSDLRPLVSRNSSRDNKDKCSTCLNLGLFFCFGYWIVNISMYN
jgi:hypothetical protein